MVRNYQKNFGKSNSAKKHQKITWKIIPICCSYNPNSNHCLLCLKEKYEIATYRGDSRFNKRTETITLADTEVSTNLPIVKL